MGSPASPAQQAPRTGALVCNRTLRAKLSGAEEYEPDHAQDQHRESGRDSEQGKHRRAGFGLACFGRGFDDLIMSSRCHGTLDSLMLLKCPRVPAASPIRGKRVIPYHVPGFSSDDVTCMAGSRASGLASLA